MLSIVDHRDSFTYNLAQLFGAQGLAVRVVGADAASLRALRTQPGDAVVLSPGPGHPDDAGPSVALVRDLLGRVPLLGVCLGHQILCRALGAEVRLADRPVHGRRDHVTHDGTGLFAGLASPVGVARYHSWVVETETLPADLMPCAWDADEQLMAVRHASGMAYGVQFHPESFLTERGDHMAARFIASAMQALQCSQRVGAAHG